MQRRHTGFFIGGISENDKRGAGPSGACRALVFEEEAAETVCTMSDISSDNEVVLKNPTEGLGCVVMDSDISVHNNQCISGDVGTTATPTPPPIPQATGGIDACQQTDEVIIVTVDDSPTISEICITLQEALEASGHKVTGRDACGPAGSSGGGRSMDRRTPPEERTYTELTPVVRPYGTQARASYPYPLSTATYGTVPASAPQYLPPQPYGALPTSRDPQPPPAHSNTMHTTHDWDTALDAYLMQVFKNVGLYNIFIA
jgi:hypothetical protein